MVLSIRLTNDSRAELACASPLQRRAIDADDLELALHYKNATTVLLQRAELLADAGEQQPCTHADADLAPWQR